MAARRTSTGGSPRHVLRRVLSGLRRAYGPRRWAGPCDPVDMLVGTILSQNTSDANSSAGFRRLKRRFPTWGAAADARASAIERCVRVSGLSRIKAPRIRRILRQVRAERGRIELGFLAEMDPAAACDALLRFDGVGPKTALCVLLFALGMPVFPVDTHIYRVSRRLGVLADRVPPQRAHEHLTPLIAPRDRYAMHVLLIAHGRATCRARRPRCVDCRILSLCPFGQEQLRGAGGPTGRETAR
jgi:endonuclease-3